MAVPRNRVSNSHKNARRAHHAKKPVSLHKCPTCEKPIKSHQICMSCGHFEGREVISLSEKKKAKVASLFLD